MRKTKEAYTDLYDKVNTLKKQGKTAPEIAKILGVSYSSANRWVKGTKREQSTITTFVEHIRKNGPTPIQDIQKMFKKHNELYLVARNRGLGIRRYTTSSPRRLGNLSTWYYLKGQESELKIRVIGMLKSFKQFTNK
ncbi:MAG: helix-turn-helix domain-containing protein [Candidatus Aenigmatarchaeota archaeon]